MARSLKIPVATDMGPANLSPSGPIARENYSGLIAGVNEFAQGINQGAAALRQSAIDEKRRGNVLDVTRANALYTKRALELENSFDQDTEYGSYTKRAGEGIETIRQEVANLIRDPATREGWLAEMEQKGYVFVDTMGDKARHGIHAQERAALDEALATNARLIEEPSTDPVIRARLKQDTLASIRYSEATGLITPDEANRMRDAHVRKAEEQLAFNVGALNVRVDPMGTMNALGISTQMSGLDLGRAALIAGNGALAIDPEIASRAAAALGDRAFPDDPALAEAYLSDPEMNARYATVALDLLTKDYDGDMTAAVIAAAPGGGAELAERWVSSKHDESILPKKVREYYRDVMGRVAPMTDALDFPIVAADGVDLTRVDTQALVKFEGLQAAVGRPITIISGHRDAKHNEAVGGAKRSRHIQGDALDLDTKGWGEEDVLRLVETASAMGFTGIGVYNNSVHLDLGQRRAWGPSYKSDSVPAFAQDVINRHVRGEITEIAPGLANVAPEYRALSFDQRMRLYDMARQELDRQKLDLRDGLEVASANAPAAIMATGTYNDTIPTAQDYVDAYGAADGIAKYRDFKASVDVATAVYSMKTMSESEIAQLVARYQPTSSGDDAAMQAERYNLVLKAADATRKARKEDPVTYAMQAYPKVAEAWKAAGEGNDVGALRRAVATTSLALRQLEIADPKLLPKEMADNAVRVFKDENLSQDERVGAVTYLAGAGPREDDQRAIFDQLVDAGLPPYTRAAFEAAMDRGDTGAAYYLFRAGLTDPKELTLGDHRPQEINEGINRIFDTNQLGDVMYGLTGGDAQNYAQMATDRTLFERAVKLRLSDGSAQSVDDAVRLTAKDMWGDVRAAVSKSGWGRAGYRIVIGREEDEEPYRRGFNALLGAVGEAVSDEWTPAIAGSISANSSTAVLNAVRDNEVKRVLGEGYFEKMGDGFTFIDPKFMSAVSGPNGQPLIFTPEEVIEAGIAAGAISETIDDTYRRMGLEGLFPEPPQ